MAALGESRSQRLARQERQRGLYPELAQADTETVFAIDRMRRQEGREPTSLGLALESATPYIDPEPLNPFEGEARGPATPGLLNSAMALPDFGGSIYGNTRARPVTAQPDPLADTLTAASPAGFAGRTALDLGLNALTAIDRPRGAIIGALGGAQGGALGGFLDPARSRAIDVPGIRSLPDEGIEAGPFNFTPRTVAGFAADAAVGDFSLGLPVTGAGTVRAAGRGARATGDYGADVWRALNSPMPLRPGDATMGASLIPGVGPDDVARIQAKIAKEGMTPENRALIDDAMGRLFQPDRNAIPDGPATASDITVNLRRAREAEARMPTQADSRPQLRAVPDEALDDPFARFEGRSTGPGQKFDELLNKRAEPWRQYVQDAIPQPKAQKGWGPAFFLSPDGELVVAPGGMEHLDFANKLLGGERAIMERSGFARARIRDGAINVDFRNPPTAAQLRAVVREARAGHYNVTFDVPGVKGYASEHTNVPVHKFELLLREAGLHPGAEPKGDMLQARILPPNPLPTIRAALKREAQSSVGDQLSFAGMNPPKVGDTRTQKALQIVADIANVPRTIQSSFDLSASTRQAGFLGPRHRTEWKNAMAAQLRALVDEDAAKEIQWEISHGQMARYRQDTTLFQAQWDGSDLLSREEAFISASAGKLPGVKQTSRAYALMLNKYRADIFDSIVSKWDEADRTLERRETLAKYLNAATGRGNIPDWAKDFAPTLNAVFFSPRFTLSIPERHLYAFSRDPLIRNEVIKDLGAFYGTGLTILGSLYAAKEAGFLPDNLKLETDFNSPDWGKVQIGDTRFDIWGGHQQFARMFARSVNSLPPFRDDKAKHSDNPLTIGRQFLRYKFGPVPNAIEELRTGKTAIGEKRSTREMLLSLVTPLLLQEMYDAYQIGGPAAAAMTLPSAIGVGTSTYEEKKPKRRQPQSGPLRPARPKPPARPTQVRPR